MKKRFIQNEDDTTYLGWIRADLTLTMTSGSGLAGLGTGRPSTPPPSATGGSPSALW